MECFYGSGASTRFAGVTARHDGSTTENGVIMLKVQDNGSSGNFNSLWLYERPGTATSMTNLSPTSKHCVVRMFVKGSTAWFHVDMDMDGYFELRSVVRTFSGAATKPVGMIGANAFGNATMDKLQVLSRDAASGDRWHAADRRAELRHGPRCTAERGRRQQAADALDRLAGLQAGRAAATRWPARSPSISSRACSSGTA
jgi:hypothetical protein